MKIYSGKLKLVGDGTIRHNSRGPSRTTRSVIEIGDTTLRNVITDNYIETYLSVGEEMEILVARFLWKKAIFGIRKYGKSYKTAKANVYLDIIIIPIFIAVFYGMMLAGEMGGLGKVLAIITMIFYAKIKIKAISQFNKF